MPSMIIVSGSVEWQCRPGLGALLRFLGSRRYLQSQHWVPHSPTGEKEAQLPLVHPLFHTKLG